ncbi:MAG: DUF2520 domain-containing protein [Bacteroidales bacterium]|nr:DUF2520 domain-containing protein [Bacteroidales bacterium]
MSVSISIVGSGNVATHLALALHGAGHTIRQVLSRSFEHAQMLARRVDAQPVNQWQRLDEDADVYILAVTDDALYDLALDLRLPRALVLHTSGTTPLSVLKPVSRHHGVLWSPQTFVRDIAMDYHRLPLCIEGSSPEDEATLEELASSVSSCIYRLDYGQRCRAHLAAVWVSNFVNAVNATAQDLMRQEGLAFDMLRPLAEQTLHKWDYGNLWQQQTGPAIRRDEKTLNAQRRQLLNQPELLRLYDQLTELIQRKS